MEKTTVGWAFKSALSLVDMKKRLDAAWPKPWGVGDSERHGDYLGGKLTEEAVARIYDLRGSFIVNLRFLSVKGDAKAQLAEAKEKLTARVLPLIEALEVQETAPLE